MKVFHSNNQIWSQITFSVLAHNAVQSWSHHQLPKEIFKDREQTKYLLWEAFLKKGP